MRIYLTGSSGFIGKSLVNALHTYDMRYYNRSEKLNIGKASIVIHLAGKAHDIKKILDSKEYYQVNTEFTKKVFDAFLTSDAKVFITLSSVKAVADKVEGELNEHAFPNPITHYGKSKLLAEKYILSHSIPKNKRVYILRPCMIHGPGNKGNLNLLYKIISKGFPWPLGNFENKRSFLSIENLCFVIKELIERNDIPSGIYNLADDIPLSTNEVVRLIAESNGKEAKIFKVNKLIISSLAILGDFLKLPFNSDQLLKLTDSYVVCNSKVKSVLGKDFPISSKEGLYYTFKSFKKKPK